MYRVFISGSILLIILLAYQCDIKNKENRSGQTAEFIGSKTCMSCHQEEFRSWLGSHHEQAMKTADSTTILADFNQVTFVSKGIQNTFFRKGSDYFVNTQGEDGKYHDYKIIYTFGVTPLQQYIVAFPDGKYQCLETAWDSKENKWFNLQPTVDIKPDEWIHWTGGGMRWNAACADCHSTNLVKNFDTEKKQYNTTFSEINVGCEACHGPASKHVKYYQSSDHSKEPPYLHMKKKMSSKELVDKCARCHSRRKQVTSVFDYTGQFLDHYVPQLLTFPTYEADGQIKDEDYVYGSFIQSKMYHNNVSCRDCHDVHSLKLKETGNTLCLSCHEPKYNSFGHHFHKENTEASQCINCHMTGKIYMGNDFRRDHSFRVPRPDQTVRYGTPNACNNCHKDKTADWASQFIISKYGKKRPEHFSDLLLAGFQGDLTAYHQLASQQQYPAIARATALNLYASQPLSQQDVDAIKKFLTDTSPLVRIEAVSAYEKLVGTALSDQVQPLLMDSIRTVRISAARYFSTINMSPPNGTQAQKELMEDLYMNADFASGQHQIGEYYQKKGNTEQAIKAYKEAISLDSYNNYSRLNLAFLLYQSGDIAAAENLYLEVVKREPTFSYSYYMLGLLYHENGNTPKALEYLKLACEKEPINLRAFYNYALKLQETGKNLESITVADKALSVNPNDEEMLYVKLLGHLNLDQKKPARTTCEKLLQIAPTNTQYQQIMQRL